MDFQRKILDKVTHIDVYDDFKHFYWVIFPKEDDGNDSDESSIIEHANTPIYDRKSEGSVLFLVPKSIKENCQNKVIVQLKNNINRDLPIPDYVKEEIQRNMAYLRNLHCTHVYKFTCKTPWNKSFVMQ